jgi:uroporphyrinogen-III synthase
MKRAMDAVSGAPVERSGGALPGVSPQGRALVVLNSRPREQAAELSRLLEAAGFEVLEAAAIETVPAWDVAELETVRRELASGAYAWVVLPSQNAARLLADDFAHARVVCGLATAQALGITQAIRLDRFSAARALEVLRPVVQAGQRILVPRAAEGRDELTDGLVALGALVHAPNAYRTVAVDPSTLEDAAVQLQRGAVNMVTVCSPSAVQSLVAGVGRGMLRTARLICLGETTALAASQAGLQVDGVALKTTMASLVDAVLAATTKPPLPVGGGGSEGGSQADLKGVPA